MTTVQLGFKAFDMHELACHFIARHAGVYAGQGLQVKLLDTNFIPDEQLPPRLFQAACGAALVRWLQGARIKVAFVACDRPMFWLVSRPEITSPEQLASRSIAGFPPGSPPALLLRLILRARGMEGEAGPAVLAVRDDAARLGLLAGGDVQAAVISSAVPPGRIRGLGLAVVQFFGAALRLPTTGLAVHESMFAAEFELVRAMCRCYRQSLQLLHSRDHLVRTALQEVLQCTGAEAGEAVELLRGSYTVEGRSTGPIQAAAIESMRWAMGGGAALPAEDLYDYAALERDADESNAEAR